MSITELKYIVALAKEQHFGRAAQSVFVSQPTLSIGIKKLEEELGIQIFERLSNKAIPTQIGQRIIEEARNTLMNIYNIRTIASEYKNNFINDVKLGAIYTICPYLLPKILPDLKKYNPNIHLYIEENYTNELIEKLKNGDLDIALISLPIINSNLFKIKIIFEEDFYIVMPKGHHLEKYKTITAKQLENERLFLLGSGNCLRDQVLQACPNFILNEVTEDNLIQGGSLTTIQIMVASGLGVSIFPKMAISTHHNITTRPFKKPSPKRQIAIVWRKSFSNENIIKDIEKSIIRCQSK